MTHRAPRTEETERTLAGIWAELLGVERVGVDDNSSALGGDSILSIQVVSAPARQGSTLTPARPLPPSHCGRSGRGHHRRRACCRRH
ncbi:phosphopantetheine-binding protein [Streptomyces tricolor]|nr:phosphopantetheine-binding protein [Streptomyces tricolor]